VLQALVNNNFVGTVSLPVFLDNLTKEVPEVELSPTVGTPNLDPVVESSAKGNALPAGSSLFTGGSFSAQELVIMTVFAEVLNFV
jgi:hypothetical protein